MKVDIKERKDCRVCQTKSMKRFLCLDDMPLTDEFVKAEKLGKEFIADIEIYVCENCYTVQTKHDVDFREYYDDYQYSVGTSTSATAFMESLANALINKYFPGNQSLKVLEVGSGDGGQLVPFKQSGCQVLGYEPSSYLGKIAESRGIPTIKGLFDKSSINKIPEEFKNVDIILLSYTFDHLPEPREFIKSIKRILNHERGILVLEVHNLENIFSRREYCLFEHEHSIYLTRATAQYMLGRQGYSIIDFDIVAESVRRANSLLVVATPMESCFSSMKLPTVELPEFKKIAFYEGQAAKIHEGMGNLEKFVEKVTKLDRKVAGYGAGGRGVMTLAALKNASKIEYLVDKSPKGIGIYAPKSHVPVVGIEKLKSVPVDDIIVFSYGYMKEIQKELQPLGYEGKQFHSMIDVLEGKLS